MGGFAWALALFVLIHIGVSATGLRTRLVGWIGEGPYRALFALVSLALLVWLIQGFAAVRGDPFNPLNEEMWAPPLWLRWPSAVLTFLGVSLAVAGVLTPGPTYAGFETRSLRRPEPAHGVLRITRNPFLWGVALWALGHLLVNGERVSVMLFGALGLMVLFGARSIDRKARARNAPGWEGFEAATSNVPFMAITQGRNRLALGEIGWRGLAGIAAAALLALGHEQVIGVPAF